MLFKDIMCALLSGIFFTGGLFCFGFDINGCVMIGTAVAMFGLLLVDLDDTP